MASGLRAESGTRGVQTVRSLELDVDHRDAAAHREGTGCSIPCCMLHGCGVVQTRRAAGDDLEILCSAGYDVVANGHTPLCRFARAAAGMALAGKGSPGGNFAARHSGELKGRFALSTACGAPASPTFVPAHAARQRPRTEARSVLVVFMQLRIRKGASRPTDQRVKPASTV